MFCGGENTFYDISGTLKDFEMKFSHIFSNYYIVYKHTRRKKLRGFPIFSYSVHVTLTTILKTATEFSEINIIFMSFQLTVHKG